MRHAQRPRQALAGRSVLTALLAVLLAVGCASGPRYGAARRKKKSCDCPHWNLRTAPRPHAHEAVRAAIDPATDDPRQ